MFWTGWGAREVRGQNAFMKKLMMIHAVTMLLLLAGMFGLSIADAHQAVRLFYAT